LSQAGETGLFSLEEAVMRRKTFDALLTTGGLVVTIVLLIAGGLLTFTHHFVDTQVRNQLAPEQIFFPKTGSAALDEAGVKPFLSKYAGQQLTTGFQAEAFADHYIAVHLKTIGGGLTYAQLSAKAQADPTNTKLAAQVETVFKGETLRGLLLNGYAFAKMAQIAAWAAIGAFAGAALMLLLSLFGFWHLRKTDPDTEVLPKLGARHPAPVEP
jgi:hypothetical protein